MARYEDLRVWQLSHQLALEARALALQFPPDERYELTSQLRRALLSVPNNLVEGNGLWGPRNYLRHVRIAIGSLQEAEYLFRYAHDAGYMDDGAFKDLSARLVHIRVLIYRLAKALSRAAT
jgi:four helix bundle protein